MDKANTIQGFMHSCYSIGALIAPLIATSLVVTYDLPWYTYYYIMVIKSCAIHVRGALTLSQVGIAVVEFIGTSINFWHKTGAVYNAEHAHESSGAGTREALKSKVTWLASLFFFAYMGVEGTSPSSLPEHINLIVAFSWSGWMDRYFYA